MYQCVHGVNIYWRLVCDMCTRGGSEDHAGQFHEKLSCFYASKAQGDGKRPFKRMAKEAVSSIFNSVLW